MAWARRATSISLGTSLVIAVLTAASITYFMWDHRSDDFCDYTQKDGASGGEMDCSRQAWNIVRAFFLLSGGYFAISLAGLGTVLLGWAIGRVLARS